MYVTESSSPRFIPIESPRFLPQLHLLISFLNKYKRIQDTGGEMYDLKMVKFFFFLMMFIFFDGVHSDHPENFIVHVSRSQKKPAIFSTNEHWYNHTLHSLRHFSPTPTKLLYTYSRAIHGFAARLSESQAAALRRFPGILSVLPDRLNQIHTTRTPSFLGLSDSVGLWPNSDYADDVIVGILDTGIWPERRSFSDEGLSPVPKRWRGSCESSSDFPASSCNRKLIGARAFYKGYEAAMGRPINESIESKSPRDTEGHGTHTASTAAGSKVSKAGFYDFAVGEARGMATKARIAVYKICWSPGCFDSDILAAMDSATADGVDVISLSVGSSGYASPYYRDSIAIGAFGAVQNGVLVSCSAGNSGPGPFTAVNVAPWILTVGASTIDRQFPADVVLGDDRLFGGVSLYAGDALAKSNISLVYGGDCGSSLCIPGHLDPSKVAGNIVLCDRGRNARAEKGAAVKIARGAGMILANTAENGEELIADAHLVPATMVGETAGNKIRRYIRSSPSPTGGIIFRGTVTGNSPTAPKVASFSSRGPNYVTPEILKPDVIAPGVNILAGWTGATGPTDLSLDPRRVEFNIISGTSMSCPHVSGLAALLRKAYPMWTPSALKSALVTTAYNTDNSDEPIKDLSNGKDSTPFIRGAGHVDPTKALDPGLVYDIQPSDYLAFLCSIGYDKQQISVFTQGEEDIDCAKRSHGSPGDLNYPSFSVVFESWTSKVKYTRSVRNVGKSNVVVYHVRVSAPPEVVIVVEPEILVFSGIDQTLDYTVRFESTLNQTVKALPAKFGWIQWSDDTHTVRSPVAFRWHLDDDSLSSI